MWQNPPLKFSLEVIKQADTLTKRITGDMLTGLVTKTPVDTGAARGNWRVESAKVNATASIADTDKGGQATINKGVSVIASRGGIGTVIYISNSLSYIEKLNNGWSMQAPANFMQLTFQSVVNKYR